MRLSCMHLCSNSLNWGSADLDWSRVQALSWQLHHLMWGRSRGMYFSSTSPMRFTTAPDVRSRTIKALKMGGGGGEGKGLWH